MKTSRFTLVALAGLALLVVATAVWASVTFDPVNGTGFVGKGDVQIAFGFNNQQMQNQAENLKFTYESTCVYDITIEWTTGNSNQKVHEQIKNALVSSIDREVVYEPRTQNQVNGFNLLGYELDENGDPIVIEVGQLPQVGDTWPLGSNTKKIITSITPAEGSASGGLYVTWNNTKVLLAE